MPARDEGDEHPDLLAGDPVPADHELDIDAFEELEDGIGDDDEEGVDA